jgi:hypothetical protein
VVSEIYAETSLINGYYSKQVRIASASNLFFKLVREGRIIAHVSDYVLVEINRTKDQAKKNSLLDLVSVCKTDAPSGKQVSDLAEIYVKRRMIPAKYIFDAYHIASASIGGYEAVVSWNFEHIVRAKTEKMLEDINIELGVHVPRLLMPEVYIW